MVRLLLGIIAGLLIVVVGVAAAGHNPYAVLAIGTAAILAVGFIARDPFITGEWPHRGRR